MKISTRYNPKPAIDANRKTAANSGTITPALNDGFWKPRTIAIDPFLPVGLLQTGQSGKSIFCELEGYKAAIGNLIQRPKAEILLNQIRQ